MKEVERNIWRQIPFNYKGIGYEIKYSLADKLKLTDDYLEVSIVSEIYGVDHDDFKDKLRHVKPQFSEDPEFKQRRFRSFGEFDNLATPVKDLIVRKYKRLVMDAEDLKK